MKRYIIDTNALLRFFLNDIPEQKIATEKLLNQAKYKKIIVIIPQIVIFELHFILEKYYYQGKRKIIEILQSLVSTNYLQTESREIFIHALMIYKSANVSFVDCFLSSNSKIEDADLFTFDKKLKKLL